jgi:hypothetical protein
VTAGDASRLLLEAFQRGDSTLVISELTLRELVAAPPAVRNVLGRIRPDLIEVLPVSRESRARLAEKAAQQADPAGGTSHGR